MRSLARSNQLRRFSVKAGNFQVTRKKSPPRTLPEITRAQWERLTERERDVCKVLRHGPTIKEIANHLEVSVGSARKSLERAMRKLRARTAREIALRVDRLLRG